MAFGQLTEFDKIVKSALEGVEEAVPSSVWDGIVSKLDVIAGAAAAGAAISSVSTGSAASGSAASGAAAGSTAAGSAATGSVASGAATGTVASSASVTGAAAGTTATGAAGSAATAAAGGAVAASSNVITITLASVAAAGVIGGGAALVLTNSNNQHIIDQPKQVTEVVVDTTSETMLEQMPEDTVDLVRYIGHQKSVIDESMPVGETEKYHPEEEKVPESIKTDVPAPQAYKPEVQWTIRPKQSHRRFAISAGYINSLDKGRAEVDFSGVYFGLSYNFPINENMGVAPGIYYSYTRKSNARCWGQYIFYSGAKIQEHYLDFPVYFNYRHDYTENISSRAFAGPTFSLGLSSSIEYDGKTYNGYEEDYSRFDVMLGGGISVEFGKKYGVLIGYDFGLLDKNKESGGPHHKRNKFYVGVSYLF